MNTDRLLLTVLVLVLLLATPRSVLAEGQQACIVLLDPGSKAVQQLDQLHTFIDVLPDTAKLDMALLPLDAAQSLRSETLDRDRRAALHLRLQQMQGRGPVTERKLIDAVKQSVRSLARVPGEKLLILVSDNISLSDSWNSAIADATDNEVKVVLVTGDANDSAFSHPLVRQTTGRQIGVTGTLLPDLIQVCGLLSADLEPGVGQDHAVAYSLEPDALQFTVYLSQPAGSTLEITAPTGKSFVLDVGAPGSIYCGTDYTCWHLTRDQATDCGWEGRWLISTEAQTKIGVWLVDSIELRVDATVNDGKRLLTVSVWRLGDRLSSNELRGQQFKLQSASGDTLIQLNDVGIGGDLVPGDGVFSVAMPEHLLPAAGSAIIKAEGRIARASSVYIDAVPKTTTVRNRPDWQAVTSGVLILTGLAGALLAARKHPAEMVLRHMSASGYLQVISLGSQPVLAGSGRRSRVRIGATSAPAHLRFRVSPSGVTLDVLAPKPATYINGKQVYLSRTLQHDDEIRVGTDTIIFQDRRRSRIGRRVAGSRQENRT